MSRPKNTQMGKKRVCSVYIDSQLLKKVHSIAQREDRTLSGQIVRYIRHAMNENGNAPSRIS